MVWNCFMLIARGDFMKNVGIKILVVVGLYVPVMFGMDDPNWQKKRFMQRVLSFTKCSIGDDATMKSLLQQLKDAKQSNTMSQEILNIQDHEGNTLLHLLARYGNACLFREAIHFGIPKEVINNQDQTVEDVLNEQILESQKTVDVDKLNALGECLSIYKSVYLKSLYNLVPMDES